MNATSAQDMGTQVVFTTSLGIAVTRNEALRAFDAVQDPTNWKLPVNKLLTWADVRALGGVSVIAMAVEFFTGSRANTDDIGAGLLVTAVGYYAACGA